VEGRSPAPDDFDLADAEEPSQPSDSRRTVVLVAAIGLGIVLLAVVIGLLAWLVGNPATAEALRDAVIVMIALESIITGVAVIVLIVQIARLTALLQNEVKPLLEASNETLRTVRGTTTFLSNNMVRPVVRLSGAAAAVRRAIELIGLGRVR
jgi:ABC-type spermidine/putrescine transport system permease subunit II